MTTTKTTCPYCGVGCGVLATREADGSVSIKGDPDHPANFGRLCSKGSALGETLDLEGRLLYPEISGERASWDQALDLVADKFSKAIAEHGPDSVAFYVSGQILTEDYYVANKLMKGFIGSANIDTNSRLCMASSVAGHRRAFGTDTVPGTYEDLELADLIILVGSNLAWCHPVIYQRIAAAKEARPEMKVVLIDPRRTMTADLADHHLAIKPDGDVALFNGLLAHLSKSSVLDHDYIEAHTSGFEDALIAATALSSDELCDQTGLELDELNAFYDLVSATQKTVTVYSQGVNQSSSGSDKVNAIINCHLATGRIGRPGMGPFSITGQPNAMGGREVGGLANMLAAHMNIENADHRDLVQEFWQSPKIADRQGLKAVDMFKAVGDGRIKALWIMATNPVDSMPDADRVQEAIKNCPFVVVSDVAATTDTVRHGHVKLPAMGWGEKDGTVTNSERRISHQKSFLSAPADAKADWWHMAEVAKRMGFQEAFEWENSAAIFREFAALSAYKNEGDRDFDIGAYAAINTKDYHELEPFQWPQALGEGLKETRFFAEGDFYTPDRKGRFLSVAAEPKNYSTPSHPFILNTGRVRDHWHTMTRTGKTARLSSHMAEPYVEIHPKDAISLGIGDADLVRVSNDNGEIIVRALITDRQRSGSVFVPMHWTDQFSGKARVDTLVPPVTDAFSGQPALKTSSVQLSRYQAVQYGFLISRNEPCFDKVPYWSKARCNAGWQAEIGFDAVLESPTDFAAKLFDIPEDIIPLTYNDERQGEARCAWFDGNTLHSAIYLSASPVSASRSLLIALMGEEQDNLAARAHVLAARPSADMPDKGAIICSCYNVGANEIATAAAGGCHSVGMIGERLNAGTNCGSCRSEIAGIIGLNKLEAAE
ncbi:MAG: molybdopterin-dependent oxidoreductase [Hyphomicrobiales bacterium]